MPEQFPGLPVGTLATQLPSASFDHTFLKTFGQPERSSACACERPTESNLAQALQLLNGPLIQKKLTSEQNRFRRMLAEGAEPEAIVRQLYLAAFCRPPDPEETKLALAHVTNTEEVAHGFEDLCWVLINANEFVAQH